MTVRRSLSASIVLATVIAGLSIVGQDAQAGCRLCRRGCGNSPVPYSSGNPYECGSGNFWGVCYYCRQYANSRRNCCDPVYAAPYAAPTIYAAPPAKANGTAPIAPRPVEAAPPAPKPVP